MNSLQERKLGENGIYDSLNGNHCLNVKEKEGPEGMVDGNIQSLVEWLNCMIPHLNLPLEASEEELRACLIDGTVLCSILNKLNPGLVEMRGNTEPGPEKIKKFLAAMDEMGLPRFVLADIQQGYMVPVLQCLGTLKAHFEYNGGKESLRNHSRKLWNLLLTNTKGMRQQSEGLAGSKGVHRSVISEPFPTLPHDAGHKFSEELPLKQGFYADLSDSDILDLMKSNGLDDASTRTLFSLMNRILDDSIERKNGHVQHMVRIMKKVIQVIEKRFSIQAENLRDQNNLYSVRTEKCQSKIKVLETLASGTTEEIQVLLSQLQHIKIEKTKIEQKEKLEEQDLYRLKEEKNNSDVENLNLRKELELAKKTHEEHCLLLEAQAKESKVELEKRLKKLECLLAESRNKMKELESFSKSKSQRWKKKEGSYQSFINYQFKALQELRATSDSIKHEVLKTKRSYLEEFRFLGVKLKGLADVANNYRSVLAENRKLYNEVQDLKGNIRVYCRIRPFLPGQYVLELMNIGSMNRAIGSTVLNERSSRSHSVLTVHVRGMDLETGAVLHGNLHLIDLAGSERVDRSEATGDRLREAQHINKSLSALGDVIFALAQKNSHVPYRNSKLTQVLQSSLGSQAKTLMFVQLNPDVNSYSETISTLKFAERVSGIQLGAARSNKEGRDIRELMKQVTSLKDIIAKKDEEIERLQLLKSNVNSVKHGTNSHRSESYSPRRHSIESPHQSPRTSGGKSLGPYDKATYDMDNSSEYSEKHSEPGSLQDDYRHQKASLPPSKSMDDLRLQKEFLPQSKLKKDVSQNPKEDIDLLGFGDADSDERLSDISDGGLSMGTETESVEFSLFPEPAPSPGTTRPAETVEPTKSPEIARPAEAAKPTEKAENTQKPSFTSKLPRPPQKLMQTRLSRLSLSMSSTPRASSSTPRKTTLGSSSAAKPPKRWH
ncbi:hypothetical protein P3X46_016732 [Hevea brasiliensis]|uniref:Kinesin motor domain-containing protein n=1 Tax=Hevea brasiliensis TaxID=3981 RepID=A0ABQ9M2D8_HEVBR|nr:hypothetical protein P3X46_016732 [Hevea brasiliensis]